MSHFGKLEIPRTVLIEVPIYTVKGPETTTQFRLLS